MLRKTLSELLYLILACFLAIVLMKFSTVKIDSRNTLSFGISDNSGIETSAGLMLFIFGVVAVFVINLIRQLKLKFTYYFSNSILIVTGLALAYFLNEIIFIELDTVKLIGKVKHSNDEIFLFRGIQIFIALIIFVVATKTIQKIRISPSILPHKGKSHMH